jgi:NADH-quinone oxidoreductase subunit A
MTHHLESTLQMAIDYLPLLILFATAGLIAAIAIAMPLLLGPKNPNKMKQEPIESGMIPFANARRRFPVQYYMVALMFILFDIEVVFLYPWAVMLNKLKVFGLIEMGVFLVILLIGYAYVWKKGAFEWD